MSIIRYLKRKMTLLSLALSRVEKSSLNQHSDALGSEGTVHETMNQGSMADALLRGEITMPVKELRWRLYKILTESKSKTAKITGYDSDGLPIVETYTIEKHNLSKISCDEFDSYDVELVIKNEDIIKSTVESFDNKDLNVLDKTEIDDYDENKTKHDLIGVENWSGRTLGEISFDDMVSSMKSKKTIYVSREIRPKFEIESYTKKLVIRKINETERLMEFYLSQYPDEYDRKTRMLISEIKKAKQNPRASDLLDINKVGFISDKAIGSDDGLEYEYDIKKFDKIVEFNGHYVIKFIADVTINGDNIFEKYKLSELELKYENKMAK
jgi:hypothetical protein